jgi:hypothetical protein
VATHDGIPAVARRVAPIDAGRHADQLMKRVLKVPSDKQPIAKQTR